MRAGIALGSNVGDRLENFRRALASLRSFALPPLLTSAVYETSPAGCPPGTPTFLNAAVEIGFLEGPEELLVRLQSIEIDLGRPGVRPKNSPRTIDLDLLYCGIMTRHSSRLELPHPRIAERLFVLQPLADIVPNRMLPGCPCTVIQLRDALLKLGALPLGVYRQSID